MGRTVDVARDRASDDTSTVLPAEIARGGYMVHPPSLAALKVMHLLVGHAGGRMGEDVEHHVRLSDVRAIPGLRNHDRTSLTSLLGELASAVWISDDTDARKVTIGGLVDLAAVDYRDEVAGDLVVSWYFSRHFTRAAARSDHWAIIDRQTAFHLTSKYSLLLFTYFSSLTHLDRVTSRTFSIPELRALLGVPEGKLMRFADLHRVALQFAVNEVSQLSRFTLTAHPVRRGRSVISTRIEWAMKPDLSETKAELARPRVGRGARRDRTAETVAVDPPPATAAPAFPADGGIGFDHFWLSVKRRTDCNLDNSILAERFRGFCAGRGIRLDARNIVSVFEGFCRSVGRV